MLEQIEHMLFVYRERLENAKHGDDFAKCLEYQGAISVLEILYTYALKEKIVLS